MRRFLAGAAGVLICISIMVTGYAHSLYPQECAANGYSQETTAALKALNEEIYTAEHSYTPHKDKMVATKPVADEAAQPSAEEEKPDFAALYEERLALYQQVSDEVRASSCEINGKLMELDLMRRRISRYIDDYLAQKKITEELHSQYIYGNIDYSEVGQSQKLTQDMLFELEAMLIEFKSFKLEIEALAGMEIDLSIDYNEVYLVTDATKLKNESLVDMSALGTICKPVVEEKEEEPQETETPDYSKEISAAVSLYYDLGAAMKEYAAAEEALKKAKSSQMLGTASADDVKAAEAVKTEAYFKALEAKSAYSATLLQLDLLCGGAVSKDGYSGRYVQLLRSMTATGSKGVGLFRIAYCDGENYFMPIAYPSETVIKDHEYDTYTISYNGRVIGEGNLGEGCKLKTPQYKDGTTTAEIVFKKSGYKQLKYTIPVFSPFGEFKQKS